MCGSSGVSSPATSGIVGRKSRSGDVPDNPNSPGIMGANSGAAKARANADPVSNSGGSGDKLGSAPASSPQAAVQVTDTARGGDRSSSGLVEKNAVLGQARTRKAKLGE